MIYSDNVLTILALKSLKGIGNAWIVRYFHPTKSMDELSELVNQTTKQTEYITTEMLQQIKEYIEYKLQHLSNTDGVVALGDDNFPAYRGDVNAGDRPVVLFYKGDLSLLSMMHINIAVIGLLKPTLDIEQYESFVVDALVKRDVVIVSGLALGCDTIAHKQTLKSGGKTVAILPSTLEMINPSSNIPLAEEIVLAGGLLITEYYEEAKSKRDYITRYIQRDRLQALFSDGVVLSASYVPNNRGLDSGSRHAMNSAYKYRIKRAVLYDESLHSTDMMYDLNRLILSEDNSVIDINHNNIKIALDKLLARKLSPTFDLI